MAVCEKCRRVRMPGEREYDSLQIFSGGPYGWYSGDDGEVCGRCLARMIEDAKGRTALF